MKNFLAAKQRENQTGREFETFLERVHQSMSPPLPEETLVQACMAKLGEDWSIALHNLCPASLPKTKAELRGRLEDIVGKGTKAKERAEGRRRLETTSCGWRIWRT